MAYMVLGSLARVVSRVERVCMGAMRVVSCLLMRAGPMMHGGLFMMFGGALVMLGRFRMMFLRGMFRHADLPVFDNKEGLFPRNVPGS
jgi:hypothetical protein